MNIKRKIIFGLILLLSLQTAEAGAVVHAIDKAGTLKYAPVSEQVTTAVSVQSSIDKNIFEDDCCSPHFHIALVFSNADLIFHSTPNRYTEKLPAKYAVSIATLLKPPKAV